MSNPSGIPVSGYNNTFDYTRLSSVTFTCNVVSHHELPFSVSSYQWNTTGCYTNNNYNDGVPRCFPHGQTTQNVTGNNLTAEDAGIVTCTVNINGSNYTATVSLPKVLFAYVLSLYMKFRGCTLVIKRLV